MKDLSMHILDIVRNAVEANASTIELVIQEDVNRDMLSIQLTDNGKGMSPEKLKNATDPFFTGRKTRKVGLGLALLQQSTEMSGGELLITSEEGKGTCVTASFKLTHIDRLPFGDLAGAMTMSFFSYPEIEFSFRHVVNDHEFDISSAMIRETLGDHILSTNAWYKEIKTFLSDNLSKIEAAKTYPAVI